MAYASESVGKDVAIDDADAARLTSLRAEAVSGDGPAIMVGVAGMVIGQAIIVTMLSSRATPLFWIHAIAVASAVVASLALLAAQRLIGPDDASLVHRWLPIARKVGVFYDAVIIVSPWLWLSLARPPLVDFVYLIYVWYLVVTAIFSNDNQGDARFGLLGVPISLATYLLAYRRPAAVPLAIVFVAIGITLAFFERQKRRQQTEAFLQRIVDEKAAAALLDRLEAASATPSRSSPLPAQQAQASDLLTPRQIEVLRQISRGFSNKQIARELNISPATVKVHVAQILAMTGSGNRTAAAVSMLRRD